MLVAGEPIAGSEGQVVNKGKANELVGNTRERTGRAVDGGVSITGPGRR